MKLLPKSKNARIMSAGRWIRLNLVLLGLVFVVSLSTPVSTLSQKLNDFYFSLRGSQPPSERVGLVLIDDASLARSGRWPWHRHLLAQLVNAVAREKPSAIGIDILLSEPEDERNDAELAQAIQAAPNVVLASKISSSPERYLWADPLRRFLIASRGVGHVQAIKDFDGLCRSIPLEEPALDGPRPAFSVKIAELLQVRSVTVETSPTPSAAGGIEQVVTRPLLIDFHRQVEPGQKNPPFITVSAADLLTGENHAELRGKAVLIGFGASDISDRLFTPVSNQLPMPGVEINANALDMLLTGRSLARVGLPVQVLLIAMVGAVSLWLVVRFPGLRGLGLVAGIIAAGYFAAFFVFLHFHLLLAYAAVLVAGVFAAPIAQLENLLFVDREVTSRLQQLRIAINQSQHANAITAEASQGRLHWKLAALKNLQAELSSLYTFQQTLLETMREALAVFGGDGGLRFSNATWKKLCEQRDLTLDSLTTIARLTGGWPELSAPGDHSDSWMEREAALGDELWLFRAVRLPWTAFAEEGAVLLVAEDITARRQRDEARSEALSFVTHELRTPLIAIQGFSELLMRYPNSPAGNEAPATIFRETNRLVAMINTYLEILRLDAGARPLRRTRVDARAMVEHVAKVVRPLAASTHTPVTIQVRDGDSHLLCDETLVSGALLNLLSNAIKYGERGTEVLLRVTCTEDQMEFEVHNSGPVIPAGELDQLFERFYRPARSESIPGWGLGLNFVRRICQQHGGAIQLSSNEISGTSFAFTLPRGAYQVAKVAL